MSHDAIAGTMSQAQTSGLESAIIPPPSLDLQLHFALARAV